MYAQICEYCKSRVDLGREDCNNCGAPVPKFHPLTNVYRHPSFIEVDEPANVWLYRRRQLQ